MPAPILRDISPTISAAIPAPPHFDPQGPAIDAVVLAPYLGRRRVIDCADVLRALETA